MRRIVRVRSSGELRCGPIALRMRFGRGRAPRRDRRSRRLTSRLERVHFCSDGGSSRLERPHLLAIERNLLLLAVDSQLATVRRLPCLRGERLRLNQLDAHATEHRFDFREPGGRHRLAYACVAESAARRTDRFGEQPVLPREEHFFPSPQLVAQPLIAARLPRLAFQCPPLFVDLEHDIVDAKEILPCGIELELGGPPPRLVFGDARGLFDQLTAIGRATAENQSDLALFDDCVGLRAEARVHQQLVDIAQPAGRAVDQVFTFAGAVQPPGHLDFARDRLNDFLGGRVMAIAVALPAVAVGRDLTMLLFERRRHDVLEHAAEPQPHFRRCGGLASVAAAEDHVLHAVAAEALRALLAHNPRNRVGHVALAASIGTDNRRHAFVEGELRAIRKGFESVDFKSFEAHGTHPSQEGGRDWQRPRSGEAGPFAPLLDSAGRQIVSTVCGPFAIPVADGGPEAQNGRQCNKA